MKKKLEAELISIAHRILQIKQKSDITTLHQEVQKLYETLSVLLFLEENFGEVKPTIGIDQVKQKIEADFDNVKSTTSEENEAVDLNDDKIIDEGSKIDSSLENKSVEEVSEVEIETTKEIELEENNESEADQIADDLQATTENDDEENSYSEAEEVENNAVEDTESNVKEVADDTASKTDDSQESEKIESDQKSVFVPSFELAFDPKDQVYDELPTVSTPQFTFDDLLGKDYSDPVFEKVEQAEAIKPSEEQKTTAAQSSPEIVYQPSVEKEKKSFSVNDRLSKGITIGLNDRIAFMKHLFGNSSEDYNRVLSQLITFDTFEEAETFIADMVKPDYNNWDGKDEYSQRFMEIVERRFS